MKRFWLILGVLLAAIVGSFCIAGSVRAASPAPSPAASISSDCPTLGTPGLDRSVICKSGRNPIFGLLEFAINWVSGMLAAYIVYVIVRYGAIGYITAQGNPEAIKEAKMRLTNAVIGLVLLSLTFVILRTIGI